VSDVFLPDCKFTPYWWERTPRPPANGDAPASLTSRVDVLVIGSGYTGLHAALQTARAGRSTLVVDADDCGFGCSTRNGGQISTSIKPGYAVLARRHGRDAAFAILQEGRRSLEWTGQFIADEKIDCDFAVTGRFHAAHNPQQYEKLARSLAAKPVAGLEVAAHLVPCAEQQREIGTDAYFGGVVYEKFAGLDPARYHQGLLERARASGATVVAHCRVTKLGRDGSRFRVDTAKGRVDAGAVVVATNGYTSALTPWLQRRVIPIGSYVIATEPIPVDVMARLLPGPRMITDSRKVVFYYRKSPDGTRILFGGRVSASETDPRVSGPRLRDALVQIFPALRDTRISHSWCGFIAYTFDELMHIGERDGLHYSMGYCGSGVGMAGYLGMRLGLQVLGQRDGETAFDAIAFQTRPLYSGNPWFLAPSVHYYRLRDRFPI
jgi:glycine/D-amino acid oxidase-like deaminating enzyme